MKLGATLIILAILRASLVHSWSFFGDEPQFDPAAGKKCPYKVLGLERSATQKDVRKTFLQLSKQYHPDVSKEPDAAERYKEINEAYEILNNAGKRKAYDEGGFAALMRFNQGGGAAGDEAYDINDIFSSFFGFGGGHNSQESMRAEPLVYPIEMPLEALYLGRELELMIKVQRLCPKYDECELKRPDCLGPEIKLITRQHAPGMFIQQQIRDPLCVGRNRGWNSNCQGCPNGPTFKEDVRLDVTIEPGSKHGQQIVISGRGQEKPGMKRGHIVFVINQQNHPIFRREGNDLYMTLDITLKQALIGFKKDIDLFGKSIAIAQAGVTPHGHVLKIQNSGMPVTNSGEFGDLYIAINVVFPKKFTNAQIALLEQAL
ncbi:DnaJ domain containing protein [Babesia divergens]|uniref:DnaJ domain containing protein n=1 Tax=Babesia divergens TaxID=32595 RepID=A0AAD9GHN5_BABDI|nr:DnaJ domain containing protein [Babesia divergens]